MRITVTSVLVDDQAKALRFYTEVLGFVKKHDVPVGEYSWLTVVSPQDPDGVELLLEPDGHPAARPFKNALVEDGIPFTSFAVEDVHAEYERLRELGVHFTQPPLDHGTVTTAVLDDTCGNLIQIAQQKADGLPEGVPDQTA
ncbi:VOC family protein [Nocardia sp. 2YAB30]|uniref:VOC family protein n=1 Tax=unclassified Nocardia TaxID=2637762 RepID=UPI003F978FC3